MYALPLGKSGVGYAKLNPDTIIYNTFQCVCQYYGPAKISGDPAATAVHVASPILPIPLP